MTERGYRATRGNGEYRYATCQEFLKIFHEDMHGLFQLSFLLTGDHRKGERCFVAGMEDCSNENRVFREWARTWAKRVIVQNAIREVQPRPNYSDRLPKFAKAAPHAIEELAKFQPRVFDVCGDRERGGRTEALKA